MMILNVVEIILERHISIHHSKQLYEKTHAVFCSKNAIKGLRLTTCCISAFTLFNLVSNSCLFAQNLPEGRPVEGQTRYSFLYGTEAPAPEDTTKKKPSIKGVFSGNIGFQCGRLIYYDEQAMENKTRFRSAFTTTINIRLYKELMLSGTFFGNIPRKDLPFWISDFYYSLKWFNWRPYTFSFGYENYVDSRFDEPASDWGKKFLQGYIFVSFNASLPKKWVDKFRLDQTTNFVFTPMIRYHPQYRDELNDILDHKPVLSLAARYTIGWRIYLESAVYYYPIRDTKVSWDPDFTYGFGYFDWRPWRVSVSYGNWIANRFSPGAKEIKEYNFLDGNFSVNFNYKF